MDVFSRLPISVLSFMLLELLGSSSVKDVFIKVLKSLKPTSIYFPMSVISLEYWLLFKIGWDEELQNSFSVVLVPISQKHSIPIKWTDLTIWDKICGWSLSSVCK